jgi:AcrR family transcriptional regulator
VDTAIRLFNESGTGPISTNHIAQAMGISPGNLYYHFANKEAVIRAIFARLQTAWKAASSLPSDGPPTVASLCQILEAHLGVVWEYRFYCRELPVLTRRDAELARLYQQERRDGLANVEALLGHFIAAGVMHSPDAPQAVAALARVCWILVEFWLPFEELSGEPVGPDDLDRGVALILQVLRPSFTAAARAELDGLRHASATRTTAPTPQGGAS